MHLLGPCKKEAWPLLVVLLESNQLWFLIDDHRWACAWDAALREPMPIQLSTRLGKSPVEEEPSKPSKERVRGGAPAPEIKCEEGLRSLVELVEKGDQYSGLHYNDFLKVLDIAIDHLILWTEHATTPKLKWEAGEALAERIRFLSSQQVAWEAGNAGFAKREEDFGDKRGARTPLGYLGWLTDNYVRRVNEQRRFAAFKLHTPIRGTDKTMADMKGYSAEERKWLADVAELKDLCPGSTDKWIPVVLQLMLEDEDEILVEMKALGYTKQDRLKHRHKSDPKHPNRPAPMRLGDYEKTIQRAVRSLAKKPKGPVRGIMRP
ncbi:MAG: hypothetical protein ABIR38_01835 [Chthoniobacterales bacterium]